jgi:hypothetical protein
MPACPLAQAAAKLHRILPAHTLNRTIIRKGIFAQKPCITSHLKTGRIRRQLLLPPLPLPRLPLRHRSPLGLGDGGLAHEKTLQLHQMLGAFILLPIQLRFR